MIVAVVLPPPDQAPRRALLDAVAAQTRSPDELRLLGEDSPDRAHAFARALSPDDAGPADWWWLLDGAAIPETYALERLIEPLHRLGPLPSPVLLTSKVVSSGGKLDPERAPWPRLLQKEVSLDACQRHLLSVRAARHGSLLVADRALRRHGPPRADYVDDGEDLEWTARMLRGGESGYLVPASVAVRAPRPATDSDRGCHRRRDRGNRLNMLRGSAWDGEEKLWFGFLLAQDIARDLRSDPRPTSVWGLAKALGAGMRLPAR